MIEITWTDDGKNIIHHLRPFVWFSYPRILVENIISEIRVALSKSAQLMAHGSATTVRTVGYYPRFHWTETRAELAAREARNAQMDKDMNAPGPYIEKNGRFIKVDDDHFKRK